MVDTYDLSAGLFVRGLTNLKTQLTKAEDHAAISGIGEAALLNAQLAAEGVASDAPADLHMYTLAAQVHWAAEGAKLAIAQLLGAPSVPAMPSPCRISSEPSPRRCASGRTPATTRYQWRPVGWTRSALAP